MTLLDVVVLVIVVVAAVAGFRRLGGTGRAGGLLGLIAGAGFGIGLGGWLAGFADGGAARTALLLLGLVIGLLGGAWLGSWIGGLLSRAFHRGHLTIVDRAVGALAGAGSALLAMWLIAWITPLLFGPTAIEPLVLLLAPLGGHSEILNGLNTALPQTHRTVRDVLDVTAAAFAGPGGPR